MESRQSSTATSSASQNDQASQQSTTSQNTTQQSKTQENATQQQSRSRQNKNDRGMARRDQYALMSPFALLQRLIADDIANLFGNSRQRPATTNGRGGNGSEMAPWAPNVDVVQRGNELVVRADLPGVTPDEVTVEVSDEAIILSGQRGEERVEDDGNVYRVERTCGAFFRKIPLPDGAMADQASASFKDGVLEITVPAPPEQVSRGRRLEINK
jgi:HSP20 family protein